MSLFYSTPKKEEASALTCSLTSIWFYPLLTSMSMYSLIPKMQSVVKLPLGLLDLMN